MTDQKKKKHRYITAFFIGMFLFISMTGPAKKSKIIDDDTNKNTAFHEAGHTLVAWYTKDATPLHKVTIIPRGMSLGHVS